MSVALFTATGARAESFALLERCVQNQTLKPSAWTVIDDADPPTKPTMGQTYIRGPKAWEPGLNTQRFNLELIVQCIENCPQDFIFILEDDDWYAPEYLERMVSVLRCTQIAGLGMMRYYHVGIPGHKIIPNTTHSALSCTGFVQPLVPEFKDAVNSGEFYIDVKFWKTCLEKKIPSAILSHTGLAVGFKGLPGRPGLTPSHKNRDYLMDAQARRLREWIGSDVEVYEKFFPVRRRG